MKLIKMIFVVILSTSLFACASTGDTVAEKRQSVMEMHDQVLSRLYKEEASAREVLRKGYGYAVFSNAQVNLIIAAAGTGYGVAVANGKRTYMKMGEAGIGFGLGVKDFRAVFVFHSKSAFDTFVDKGWQFGAEADAAAKAGNQGGEISEGASYGEVTVYQLTESGLALQATIKGTKYWKDAELN